MKPMPSPIGSDLFEKATRYQPVGVCRFCLKPLEAIQPGGSSPRHCSSEIPYGGCR